jgi:hypothetical protein
MLIVEKWLYTDLNHMCSADIRRELKIANINTRLYQIRWLKYWEWLESQPKGRRRVHGCHFDTLIITFLKMLNGFSRITFGV